MTGATKVVVAGSVEVGEKIYNVLVSAEPELPPLLEVPEVPEIVAFPETEPEILDPAGSDELEVEEGDELEVEGGRPEVWVVAAPADKKVDIIAELDAEDPDTGVVLSDSADREVEFVNEVTELDVEFPDTDVLENDVVEFALTELEKVDDWDVETVPGAMPERVDDEEFPPGTLNELRPLAERRTSRATLRRLSR